MAAPRILVVEDDETIADLLAEMVVALGYAVAGTAHDLAAALALAATAPLDCAILDVSLGRGITSMPVARILTGRGIPFLFATAYDADAVEAVFRSAPILKKPVPIATMREILRQLVA